MNCPLCLDQTLTPHIRDGVEIDVCPQCRGLWLDRGELDKLAGPRPEEERRRARDRDDDRRERRRDDDDDDDDRYERSDKRSKKKRKKSFAERLGDALEEVIDL